MDPRTVFNQLIALAVAAGLLMAPLSVPAMAVPHPMAVADEMQADEIQAMADDMPCCPDQHKNTGCQDCPLVAICMLSALPAKPSTDAVLIRLPSHRPLRAYDDMIVDGLIRPPPDRPPRLLV